MANGAQFGRLIDLSTARVDIYRPGQQPETLTSSKCWKVKARLQDSVIVEQFWA